MTSNTRVPPAKPPEVPMFEKVIPRRIFQVYVRVTEEEMDWIEERARVLDRNKQEVLREALRLLYQKMGTGAGRG